MCGIGIKSTGIGGAVDITWKLDFFDINNTRTNWLFGVSLDARASDDASDRVKSLVNGVAGLVIVLGISGMLSVRSRASSDLLATEVSSTFADAIRDAVARTAWMSIYENFAAANFSLKACADDVTAGRQPSNAMYRNALHAQASLERLHTMVATGKMNGC